MTTATLTPSAYPAAVEALLPQARQLADQLGDMPSRNRLMKEFKVGAPKAQARREALAVDAETVLPELIDTPADTPGTVGVNPDTPGGTTMADLAPAADLGDVISQADPVGHPGTEVASSVPTAMSAPMKAPRRPVAWPVLLLAMPAFVAIWSGWVSLGELSGFGIVHPLPGIADSMTINTAITLPIGVETYAAYALWVWLSGRAPQAARKFAKWSAIGSLVFGAAG